MRPRVAFVSDAHEFAGAEHYLIFIIAGLRERFEFVVVAGQTAPELRDKVRAAGAAAGHAAQRHPRTRGRP